MTARPSASRVPEEQRRAYGAELRRAMERQRLTIRALATQVGISPETIASYRIGRVFPSPGSSQLVAEALGSDHLRRLGTWSVPCAICKRPIEASSRGGHAKMYCGGICRRRSRSYHPRRRPATKRAKAKVYRVNRTIRAENTYLRDVIRANCDDCAAHSGICPEVVGCVFIPVTELRKSGRAVA